MKYLKVLKWILSLIVFCSFYKTSVFAGIDIPIYGKLVKETKEHYIFKTGQTYIQVKKSRLNPTFRKSLKFGESKNMRFPASAIVQDQEKPKSKVQKVKTKRRSQ